MKKLLSAFALFAMPLVASAAVQGGDLESFIVFAGRILSMLIPLLIAAALVAFFWGLVKYVWSGGEEKKEGTNIMIAGIISLFVMVSVWGIVRIAQNTLGITGDQGSIVVPSVPRPR